MSYKYLFGPVPSRRLGISLGIDLVPHKVCSLNCVYCEVGRSTNLTNIRKEYILADEVIKELKDFLSGKPQLDYLTFSGAGEPTLNSGIGRVIKFLRKDFPEYKIALLTNGTLFSNEQVREEILSIDLLLPSLDAASEKVFQMINRPAESITAAQIIDGLKKLQREFSGKMWLEIFFIPGLNDTVEELTLLKKAVLQINPDRVQLNSLDRPGTEVWVEHTTQDRLKQISDFFKPLPVEIIAKPQSAKIIKGFKKDIAEQILGTIKRRPCTSDDLKNILNLNLNELNKYLNIFLEQGKIESVEKQRGTFFKVKNN